MFIFLQVIWSVGNEGVDRMSSQHEFSKATPLSMGLAEIAPIDLVCMLQCACVPYQPAPSLCFLTFHPYQIKVVDDDLEAPEMGLFGVRGYANYYLIADRHLNPLIGLSWNVTDGVLDMAMKSFYTGYTTPHTSHIINCKNYRIGNVACRNWHECIANTITALRYVAVGFASKRGKMVNADTVIGVSGDAVATSTKAYYMPSYTARTIERAIKSSGYLLETDTLVEDG
jgi:hypothetical protein